MAGAVGVEEGGVAKVVSNMETAINNLRTSVKAIDDASQAVRRGWKGDANDEFMKVSKDWDDEAIALNKKLDELQQAVNTGKSTIVNMDQGGLGGGGSTGGGGGYTNL
ncbi:WXG100 family type VII secretion target [Nocardia pseudobrasiliensis]|uniref:WXG100 family type VII secretion target n=1 Tax=Nocardia pseudobrasiliensis TaxID=45979 RepID=A0A370I197_9NOCA|nr:WXG100 family type VII secretion target [Nocardia pseudobrasiliensis]RDI64509.1 WXG100 family type VII secretion target [Nocardia pseudobrasiliensis]